MSRNAGALPGLAGAGKFTELRQRLLFVVGALIVYRIGCFIPVPGVDPEAMLRLMENQGGIVDMFNMFSGGALSRFSIFALNVMPYISASIVMQLMVQILPSLKALQKEGESGRRKITQYSRVGAVFLAIFQAAGIAIALQGQGGSAPVVYNPGPGFVLTAVVSLTAGTMFLMWMGEQITERGIGNGVSLIIFAGIVAGLPGAAVFRFANTADAMWGYRGVRGGRDWTWAGKWAARADDVLAYYATRAKAAGYPLARSDEDRDVILSGVRGAGRYAVAVRERDDGMTDVVVVTAGL